jgi:dipeptidyl aminopeptidase/acylaminoacyl peptidase
LRAARKHFAERRQRGGVDDGDNRGAVLQSMLQRLRAEQQRQRHRHRAELVDRYMRDRRFQRFAAGVDIVGISNFVTFLENTSGYRRDLRRVEYGDERDPAMRAHLQKISPLTNAARIAKPMFIVQGFNDPRVPYTEAEQMLAALRRNNLEVWFMMAKDEGHGFAKKSNQEAQREAETLFFQKILGTK